MAPAKQRNAANYFEEGQIQPLTLCPSYEVSGCLPGLAIRTLPAGVRKASRREIAGCKVLRGSDLSAGYGDLERAPVAASAQRTWCERIVQIF
jgi:hypothetical protein